MATIERRRVAVGTGVALSFLECGTAAGAPIVLLHGYTSAAEIFRPMIPLLAEHHRVLAVDLRGHGESDKPREQYTQDVFVSDVIAFLDALGIEHAVLVGHSMGSFIARGVAIRAPQRAAGLVLVSSTASIVDNPMFAEAQKVIDTLEDPISREVCMALSGAAEGEAGAVSDSLRVPAHVWKSAMAGMRADDHRAQLGAISAPTLIAWGDADVFTAAEQEDLVRLIPGSELKPYPGAGHDLPMTHPRELAAAIVGLALEARSMPVPQRGAGVPTKDANKLIVRAMFELWNGDVDALDRLVAPELVNHSPLPGFASDRAGLLEMVRFVRAAFPEGRYSIEDMVAEGDMAMVRYRFVPWHGAPREDHGHGLLAYRFRDHRMVERWCYSSAQ